VASATSLEVTTSLSHAQAHPKDVSPFQADDDHRFDLQWQSPTGATITFHEGAVDEAGANFL